MKTEVLIIGAGCGGLIMALMLGLRGVPVTLIEGRDIRQPEENSRHFGRTAALFGKSIDVLKTVGLWDEIASLTSPLKTMRIIDDGNPALDPVVIVFPASDLGLDCFGHNVPNALLQNLALKKLESLPCVTLICPARLDRLGLQGGWNRATLDDGRMIDARLVIAADGKKSKTRALAGIQTDHRPYDQTAITCLLYHTKPHENISTEHHRAAGPFTFVPMPDVTTDQSSYHHCSSLVWVETTQEAQQFMAMDKSAFTSAIQKRSRGALGEITLGSPPESWALEAVIAKSLTAPRLALIAEAAHAMSPIGAQGLNLSLRDIAGLSRVLLEGLALGEDIGSASVLSRYADQRRFDLFTRFEGVDRYNRLVSNNIPVIRAARRFGLKALDKIPTLKSLAMRQGLTPFAA